MVTLNKCSIILTPVDNVLDDQQYGCTKERFTYNRWHLTKTYCYGMLPTRHSHFL